MMTCRSDGGEIFLSTPSARRATETDGVCKHAVYISIHALREEGDETQRTRLLEP